MVLNVLYIDGVGPWGGASRSLYEALSSKELKDVQKYFVMVDGTVVPHYSSLATESIIAKGLTRFDNTEYSYYRGLRWIVLLREIFHLPFTISALLKAKKHWGNQINLIHVNELTEIFPLLIARYLFKVPVICHVRSVTRNNPKSIRCRWLHKVMQKKINSIIAIDETVRESLPKHLNVNVIHNSFTPKYSEIRDNSFESLINKIPKAKLTIGFVGNLLKSKGISEMLEAAKKTKELGLDINYIIIGGGTRELGKVKKAILKIFGVEQDFYEETLNNVAQYGLENNFHLVGPTFDIQRGYEYFDVNCFASHFNAPGRPVFEAAYSGVPSIVAVEDPKSDTLINMETGIAIPGKNVEKLVEAIVYFYNNLSEVKRMGENAKKMAIRNFSPDTNALKIYNLYKKITYEK